MSEKTQLLSEKISKVFQIEDKEHENINWSGTPGLRKLWTNSYKAINIMDDNLHNDSFDYIDSEHLRNVESIDLTEKGQISNLHMNHNYSSTVSTRENEDKHDIHDNRSPNINNCILGTPGLLIAVVLNLFLSMSFGQAFFPSSWIFPSAIPRSIGVQMFLLSTLIGQLVMTTLSDFPSAMGMMMVENIPFMHIIAEISIKSNGPGIDSFSTVFVTFGLSSIVVGVFFYLLGAYEIGNAVYFFPRHVIIGCIGGIGIFIIQTGMEVSADAQWLWDYHTLKSFFETKILYHWLASIILVSILRIILAIFKAPFLPPFYFISIPPVFYILLSLLGIPVSTARNNNWFFPTTEHSDPFLIWELIQFNKVNWETVGSCIPSIIALTIFSLMHVPINIPSLSMSTHRDVDINKELVAHGYSNLISGCFGGLQNYLCYSNSLLYYKCRGGGKLSGYLIALITAGFFYIGPTVVTFMPRVMPGCLLIHIGLDLSMEALVDSWTTFDSLEYSSIVAITVVMTFYGMTAGLALGVICAALTFTLQTSRHVTPIRGKMCAQTLRSSRWRSVKEKELLSRLSRHIIAIQLQGHLFFGNATILAAEVERIIRHSAVVLGRNDIWFVILDFTLVVGIDSSAAETILKIFKYCRSNKIRLCYSTGSGNEGFPCMFPLSENIEHLDQEKIHSKSKHCIHCGSSYINDSNNINNNSNDSNSSRKTSGSTRGHTCRLCGVTDDYCRPKWVFHSANLDAGLAWCEDIIIYEHSSSSSSSSSSNNNNSNSSSSSSTFIHTNNSTNNTTKQQTSALSIAAITSDIPPYLHQIYIFLSNEPKDKIDKLLSYFARTHIDKGTIVWIQGETSDRAILVISGLMEHVLEEEAGTKEYVYPGHLVGEYGLINEQTRSGTLSAIENCSALVLNKSSYESMLRNDPYLAFILSKICMAYLGRRVMHVANRIWESHCLPV